MSATPSQFGRIAACPTSETLPHAGNITRPSRRGLDGHRFLAHVLEYGKAQALKLERPENADWLDGLDISRLPANFPTQFAPEVAFAWDPKTGKGRELGRNLSREEAAALALPGELVGIADIAGVTDTRAVIHDYKLGHGWIEPAEVNWQVKTYAMMAAAAYGKDEAEAWIQRAFDDGKVFSDHVELDYFALEEHAEKTRALLARREELLALAAAGEHSKLPPLYEGPHCRFCPALWNCPVKITALVALASPPGPDQKVSALELNLTPERAAGVWLTLKLMEKRIDHYLAVVKDMAAQAPLAMPNGKVLGRHLSKKREIDPVLAEKAFMAMWGEEIAGQVYRAALETKQSISQDAFRRALKTFVLPTLPPKEAKITWVFDGAMEKMVKTGGVEVKRTHPVEEFWPEDEEPDELPPAVEGATTSDAKAELQPAEATSAPAGVTIIDEVGPYPSDEQLASVGVAVGEAQGVPEGQG